MKYLGTELLDVLNRHDPSKLIGLRGPDDWHDAELITLEKAIELAHLDVSHDCCKSKQCVFCQGRGSFTTPLYQGTGNINRIHFLRKARQVWSNKTTVRPRERATAIQDAAVIVNAAQAENAVRGSR